MHNFNPYFEKENLARVETFNGRIIREAEKAATRSTDVICEERSEGYGVYTLPKTFVKIRGPIALSEETLAKKVALGKTAINNTRKTPSNG